MFSSQWYARASSSYECFVLRAMRLSNKLLGQEYVKERLRSSLRKFYGRYGDLIKQYEVPLSRMLHDILDDNYLQWHPPLIRGAVVAEWLSSWLAEQEDRGSIPGLATWIFRDWLSPASKSRYGWKIAKSTLILKTTNQSIDQALHQLLIWTFFVALFVLSLCPFDISVGVGALS